MPARFSDVGQFAALTARWLIEALGQMSSNPRVCRAAAAWLDARRSALELGLAEEEAQARADATLQREVGTDSPRFGHERHQPVRNPGGLHNAAALQSRALRDVAHPTPEPRDGSQLPRCQ